MPTVNFKIHSKNYSVDCGAGQEDQIRAIASQIDAKVKNLSSLFGEVDNETLLLMVCILTFGDNAKAKAKILNLEAEISNLKDASLDEDALVNIIDQLTSKIKSVSDVIDSQNDAVPEKIVEFRGF